MIGAAVLFGSMLAFWAGSLLRDRMFVEHLQFHRVRDELFFMLGGQLERSGHHVRDLTLMGP